MSDVIMARDKHYQTINDLENAAVELANAEYRMDVEVASQIAAERSSGTPVTIIEKIVRGIPEVAEKRSMVTVATGLHKAAQARVQATYLEWKYAMEVEDRDWRQSGGGAYGA